jgi:RimJ/RimL family protein N-acetyltransferase
MGLIRGARVDLVTPFPSNALRLVYEWIHACGEFTEDDDSPKSAEAYASAMGLELIRCTSYGLRRAGSSDGWIGLLHCEPAGPWNGYLHITMPRHAWGHGLADEAMALAIRDQFKRFPKLARLSAAMIENNRPAQALAQRMGFRCEATLPAMVVQGGTPRSVVHYGLTRREWEQSVRSRKTKRSGG